MGHSIHGAHRVGLLKMLVLHGDDTTDVLQLRGDPLHKAVGGFLVLIGRGAHRVYKGSIQKKLNLPLSTTEGWGIQEGIF